MYRSGATNFPRRVEDLYVGLERTLIRAELPTVKVVSNKISGKVA